VRGVVDRDALEAVPVPATFVAVTVKVYAVPLVRPVMVQLVVKPFAVTHDLAVSPTTIALYEVIALPPLLPGAVQDTDTCALPGVTMPIVGAPGTVRGVVEDDALEAMPVPATFVAVTVNVYAVPLVRPVTTTGEVAPVPVIPLGFDVTV
jgi:hypothetical protein